MSIHIGRSWFLGTVGVIWKWIKNFTKIALPLTMLTRHSSTEIFNWSTEANEAFEQLKFLVSTAPPLIKIDFKLALKITCPEMRMSDLGLVTIAVDSSIIGAGWILSQITEKGELQYFLVLSHSKNMRVDIRN